MDLNMLRDMVVMIALVALIGAVSAIVLTDFQEDLQADDITSVSNETVTMTAGTGAVNEATLFVSVSGCRNQSAGQETLTVGVSCNVTSGTVSITNTSVTSAGIDYTHYTPTAQRNMTVDGLQGEMNATNYLSTIGTIAGVAVLIAIVIGAFYFATKTE